MKYLVIAVLALAIAVVLGQVIADDAGFVVIGYGGKVFRTSFAFFVVLLAVAMFALYLAWRFLYQLFTLKTRWHRWSGDYRRKRAQRALSTGLIALAEGKFNRAEKLLSRGADQEAAPALHYLGAAEAAQAQNAIDRRDNYLSLAREAMPSAEIAIGIKRAEMQLENTQFEQARATLEYLADRHPDNKQVLSLQQRIYSDTSDHAAVLSLLPALRRHRVYPPERLAALELDTARDLLSVPAASVDELNALWRRLPKSMREHERCIAEYARQLHTLGFDEEAESLLRKSLTQRWDDELAALYGEVRIPNAALQLERAETWLATRSDDPVLLMSVAQLAIATDDWPKARRHLNALVEAQPSPMAYRLLADVHEQAEETEAANACQRAGLQLATNAISGLPAVRS